MSIFKSLRDRAFFPRIFLLLRVLAIIGLALLVVSLFVPTIGEASVVEYVFGSPRNSPIPPDPPGQSHSPPGPFISPPGLFKSPPRPYPPGGAGVGTGPGRSINLTYVEENNWVNSPDATGYVEITESWRDNHPTYPGFPQYISYSISKLECLWAWDRPRNDGFEGQWFYSLYITIGNGPRQRLQSFNPGCGFTTYKSGLAVPDISEEALFSEDLVFEVIFEKDDGVNTPQNYPEYWNWVILRGQDLAD